MTPGQIIALVRDVAIVGALVFIIWWIRAEGENTVKLADLQAVQKQLQAQSQTVSQWHQEAQDAQALHTHDLAQVTAAIGAQRAPIRLCAATAVMAPVDIQYPHRALAEEGLYSAILKAWRPLHRKS